MKLKASFMIAWRSLSRRKSKNLSAILAVTLGVALLVGITITTDTLKNAFLTSLLQTEGEVDLEITNSTRGSYLKASDGRSIAALAPDAVGIMPELSTQIPALVESQFDPKMSAVGIALDYPSVFGDFYDWKTGSILNPSTLLKSNKDILLSRDQAKKLGLSQDTLLPLTLTTEFTNLTTTIIPPIVPLSKWSINKNLTSGECVLNNSESSLSLELLPTGFMSMATIYTVSCPQLSLSNYAYVNVTAKGTSNARVIFGFFLDDGSNITVANVMDPATLDSLVFNLTPYAGRTLGGEGYMVIMSLDGTRASINISEIAFEASNLSSQIPLVRFTSTISRVELQIVGIFDSKRPGIGSQYSGAVFRLEHLQEWISIQDPEHETDIISSFLVAYKADHFTKEIQEDYLKAKLELLKTTIPKEVDPQTRESKAIYQVTSTRLNFFSLASFFITLISTILSSLGFLITLTGVLLITNIQLMNVEDREFQTGVLRAIGANRTGIFQSIMIENLFQGIIGGILGLIGGLAFGQSVAIYLVGLFETGELSIQPVISQVTVVLSVIIGVTLSIITGILPALRASQVNVVEALRGIKVKFKAKSSRNLTVFGLLMIIAGITIILYNGVFDKTSQVFWISEGWDSLGEWRNLMLGFGLFMGGLGFVMSRFMDRVKAFNITAFGLWVFPSILFVIAMGNWVTSITGLSVEILILGIIEIIVGSILFVALNLPIVMRGLRNVMIKIRGLKGVGQVSPALISSHITRSTLTFAIFAVILTLNVLVAALIPTSLGTVTKIEEDSKGVDFAVYLNKPEAIIPSTSFSDELYNVDERISDVVGFKTFKPNQDYTKFIALENPLSPEFDYRTDLLPIEIGEFKSEQIRGNASGYSDDNWRYAFYLSSFPDGIRELVVSDQSDNEMLALSKKSWNLFFDPQYKMAGYNVSSYLLSIFSGKIDLSELQLGSAGGSRTFSGSGEDPLAGVEPLKNENGSITKNPIVLTDSYLLPVGLQIWIPMNVSSTGLPTYQAFTIGGCLDYRRAGGFPLSAGFYLESGDLDISEILGRVYLPEHWANQTNFLGEANGQTLTSRGKNQYNTYLIKTGLSIDDPELENISQKIEKYVNKNDEGYRLLASDNFFVASTTLTYSRIELTLKMTDRIQSFLQIYVTFGLVIGALGMGVISVRNVSERKREIGMMRAIGFSRSQVILSVLLELVILGVIGLGIGVVNGLLISTGFANMQNTALIIPWQEIGLYLSIIVLVAIGSGSLPALAASRIPPAEALRYVG